MGRWGKGIYDSDDALDFFQTITDQIEREAAYWFSPEQVIHNGWWLAQVLAVMEVILLFEENDIGSSSYFNNTTTVRRWRDIFMSVWDGDWKHDNEMYDSYPHGYDAPNYRKQHRPGIVDLFERMENLAYYWTDGEDNNPPPVLIPLLEDYPLPFFSLLRVTNRENKTFIGVEPFTHKLIESRVKEIIYLLSGKRKGYVDEEKIWVSVDVLGLLCQTYEQSPTINNELVRTWHETTIQMWTATAYGGEHWEETDELYQNVKAAFDRLEAIARKYPPYEW